MRFLRFLVLAFVTCLAGAQNATITHNVNLRSDPSTDSSPIAKLKPPAQVDLLEPGQTAGYFHVKTSDGDKGWVWAKNVRVESAGNTPAPTGSAAGHIGPPQLYPDPTLTPGKADTLNIADLTRRYTSGCPHGKSSCTYSQSHRDVSSPLHTAIYDEYQVPPDHRNRAGGEVDHFYPLCAGGSNDQGNLWFQAAENEWNGRNFGYHEKDKLEAYVCAQIKAGKIQPKDAFDRITKDWVKFYLDEGLDND